MTSPFRGPQSLLPVLLRQSLTSTFCRLLACAVGRDPGRIFPAAKPTRADGIQIFANRVAQGSRLKGTDRCFAAKRDFSGAALCDRAEVKAKLLGLRG